MTDTELDVPLAHTELDISLAYFSSAPNSPLKVDLDPRQAYFIFSFYYYSFVYLFE